MYKPICINLDSWIAVLSMVGWHPMIWRCVLLADTPFLMTAISMAKKRGECSLDSQGMEWDIQVWNIIKWIYIYIYEYVLYYIWICIILYYIIYVYIYIYTYVWVWFKTIGPELLESRPEAHHRLPGGSAKLRSAARLQRAAPRGLLWSKDDDLMGFYGDSMGFYRDSMGFYRDSMGY